MYHKKILLLNLFFMILFRQSGSVSPTVLVINKIDNNSKNVTCMGPDGAIDPTKGHDVAYRRNKSSTLISACEKDPPENWTLKRTTSYGTETIFTNGSWSKPIEFKGNISLTAHGNDAFIKLNEIFLLIVTNDYVQVTEIETNKIIKSKTLKNISSGEMLTREIEIREEVLNNLAIIVDESEPLLVSLSLKNLIVGSKSSTNWTIVYETGANKYWWTNQEIRHKQFLPLKILKDSSTLCVSLYVRMCENCKMDIGLATITNHTIKSYKLIDHDGQDWRTIHLEVESNSYGNYTLVLGTESETKDSKQFWAIDDIEYCKKPDMIAITKRVDDLQKCECKFMNYNITYAGPKSFEHCLNGTYKDYCYSYQNALIDYQNYGNVICFGNLGENVCYCTKGYEGRFCQNAIQNINDEMDSIRVIHEDIKKFTWVVIIFASCFLALLLVYVTAKCIRNICVTKKTYNMEVDKRHNVDIENLENYRMLNHPKNTNNLNNQPLNKDNFQYELQEMVSKRITC